MGGEQAAPTLEDARALVAEQVSALDDDTDHLDIWTPADVLSYFQRRQSQPSAKREYVSLGLEGLEDGTYIEPGDVLVIAGEPSAGKTALGLLTAYHMAAERKVGFFSLETRNEKLADRLIAGQIGIDFERIKRSTMTEADWQRFAEAGADFSRRQLSLIPCGGATVSRIQAITQACGFEVIFVDYAQLIQPESQHVEHARRLVRDGIQLAARFLHRKQAQAREPIAHSLRRTHFKGPRDKCRIRVIARTHPSV